MHDEELTIEETNRLFEKFQNQKVAVAVSGGADSMALAFCMKRAKLNMLALIVEHGLREESADEAQTVANRLNNISVSSIILPWHHDKIETRVHVKAREARYELLLNACKEKNIKSLFFAHHQDDQAETILMRFAKGSGIYGLAGMSEFSVQKEIEIIRPFLKFSKNRLIATCNKNNISYVIDPSNEKACYARGRLRRVTDLLEKEGFTTENLVNFASRAKEAKEAIEFYTNELCNKSVFLLPSGALKLDLNLWKNAPTAIRLRLIEKCLLYFNPTNYSPERKQLLSFVKWIENKDEGKGRTFHGVFANKNDAKQTLIFIRELSAIKAELTETGLWDNRWNIVFKKTNMDLSIKKLGIQKHGVLDKVAPNLRKEIISGKQRSVLPALWEGNDLISVIGFSKSYQDVVFASLKPICDYK